MAGIARVRSVDRQAAHSIVPSGPWKNLAWPNSARFRPVQVSSGPLLFIHAEDRRLKLVDPERESAVQDLGAWGDFDSIIDRLDSDHVLVESDGLAIWQMSSGKTYSVPGGKFITLDGNDCYFFEATKKLSGRLGKLTPKGWQWLSSQPFESVVAQTDTDLIATTNDQVFLVSKQGKGERKLASIPYHTYVDAALSPDRSKIALGCCACSEATLLVLDLQNGQVLCRKGDMTLPGVGSSFPHLYCSWLDGSRVRYLARSKRAFCFRDYDLNTRRDSAGPAIQNGDVGYPDPRPELPAPSGSFSVREAQLYCGEKRLGPVYGFERFAVEPSGRWAAATGSNRLRLWDSSASATLLGTKPFEVGWLPAVGTLPTVRYDCIGIFPARAHRYRFSPREPNVGV